jgi:hypothetical protein
LITIIVFSIKCYARSFGVNVEYKTFPKVSDEIGILLHTIEIHDACSTFSMRKSVFDEKIGCNAYRSQHFPAKSSYLFISCKDSNPSESKLYISAFSV